MTPKTFTCKVSNVDTNLTMQGGTYDWAHMPYVPREVTYDWNNVIGIAKLTSDAGISVCMSYKSGGSSSSSVRVGDSLVSTFGYANAVADYESGGVRGNTFKKNVIPSLDAKLPVILGIQGRPTGSVTADAGHSILTDGYGYYNNQLYIHLNMGWSGSDDAWYTPADADTDAIINASNYNFTNIHTTVFNIFTNATRYSVIASGRVLDQSGEAISGATVTAKYNNTTYATATSDARGVYALILKPTSENSSYRTYTVNATCSGYTSTGARSVSASRTVGEELIKDGNNYTGSFYLTAFNSNSYDNDITMESDNLPQAATPTSATAAEFETSASVTLTCSTAGASIYYTLDGSTPTVTSTLYTGPIPITKTTTVKALAAKSGYARSDVFTRTFVSAAAIDEFYFRHDFSNGTRVFTAGEGSGLTRDQTSSTDSNAKAVEGPDGPGTAHHPGNVWGQFEDPTVLHGAWSAAMSLCMDDTETGALISFGRLNKEDQKEVALLSSSTKSNFYFKVITTDSSKAKSVENTFTIVTTNDLTVGFHSIVVAYTPASEVHNGVGSFDIYCDGVLVRTVSTDTPKLLGADVGGMQYCHFMSGGNDLTALGAVSSQANDAVAFYDFRFYDRAFTASEAAKYAAAYPNTASLEPVPDPVPSFAALYAQSGTENLLLHLDAVENAGVGLHEASPETWADLTGSHTVTETGSAGFQSDAWTADGSSYFRTSSTAAKDALAAKAFTLELVISNPGNQAANSYEYWMFFGADNSNRQLVVDLREKNSKNPLVQGVQYRETGWNSRSQFSTSTITKWNTRQYIAVVCDSTEATTYCNGTNQIHKTAGGSLNPSQDAISIGAAFNGGSVLYSGSEICAVRMTSRVLTAEERLRNWYVDSQRFGLESAPDGYRLTNGVVQVRLTAGVEGFEFSTNGTTWAAGEVWTDINQPVTLSARLASISSVAVSFSDLPAGATVSGNSATFTPAKPCAIIVSAAQWTNNDGTGSFDSMANWIGGSIPQSGDFIVNISGDTTINVANAYNLGVMTVQGTGNVTFTGAGSIVATMLNIASGLTVDTSGKVTVPGFTGAGNVILTPASGTLAISSASTLTGDLTIKTDSSVAFNVNAATSVSNFFVRAATNAVVTMTVGSDGSFISAEAIVKSGVLKLGADCVLGATPKVTVEDGGTFDFNGKVVGDGEAVSGKVVTAFHIAGAGAGNWPWAITSSANMTNSKNLGMLHLDANATIGGANELWMGVRNSAGWSADNKNLNLNGFTLTKTGTGTLQVRRPYSKNEGTIDVYAGTLRVSGWSKATAAYGESCVSNVALVVREGVTAENSVGYPLYFRVLDCRGGTLTTSASAFGVWETLSGHGSPAKLSFGDGATATLDGNLTISSAMTAADALSLTRAADVETNVTVAATGTLTASGVITVGAGVIFDIGANRPAGTLTVADGATLALRKADSSERNVVLNVTAQPQNIVVYDTDGTTEISDSTVTYNSEAGTLTIRFASRWTNNDGTGLFDSVANWTVTPENGDKVILELSGDTLITVTNTYNLGTLTVTGTGNVTFTGDGSIAATTLYVASGLTVDTSGKLTVAGFTGAGNVVLTPASDTLTISSASTLTGDLTIKTDTNTAFSVNAATSVRKFYVNAATNAVVTMTIGSGGSFKATSEAIVQHGVLQQGGNNVLGTTPKISVENDGTFDINAKTIRQETPIYIAGAGADDWPWALATTSGAMASGNYLYNLYLNADATIGAGQFKFGQDNTASKIKLNGHTLTAKSWMTFRNINTDSGTIDLQPGNGTGISLNQYNNLNTGSGYSDTTLILRSDTELRVQNRGTYNFAVVDTLKWYGGTLITDPNNTDRGFGVRVVLEGYGTTKYLKFLDGARFKPDGEHYLNVTEKLEGKLELDVSGLDLNGKKKIPLLKVPADLKTRADDALKVEKRPKGWSLQTYESDGNVRYDLRKDDFTVTIR